MYKHIVGFTMLSEVGLRLFYYQKCINVIFLIQLPPKILWAYNTIVIYMYVYDTIYMYSLWLVM